MQKIMGLLLMGMSAVTIQAQTAGLKNLNNATEFMSDANGRPLLTHAETKIEGSPYFSDDYSMAIITIKEGKKYDRIPVKLNLESNRLIYKTTDGKEMEAVSEIASVQLYSPDGVSIATVFATGYPAIDHQTTASYYVVLDSGNVQLLKLIRINGRDQRDYNSAAPTHIYEQATSYYAYSSRAGMVKLKSADALYDAFADKKAMLQKFVAQENIKVRKEEDLIKAFAYGNTSGKQK